jgi:hypothetical protein
MEAMMQVDLMQWFPLGMDDVAPAGVRPVVDDGRDREVRRAAAAAERFPQQAVAGALLVGLLHAVAGWLPRVCQRSIE